MNGESEDGFAAAAVSTAADNSAVKESSDENPGLDIDACARLFMIIYLPQLIGFAVKRGVDPYDASILATEVSFDVVLDITQGKLIRRGNPGRRLYRVLKNRMLNLSRRDRRSTSSLEQLERQGAEPVLAEADFDAAALQETLMAAIDRLSPQHKRVIYLMDWQGFTPAQIAPMLGDGTTAKAVWHMHSRAIQRLRRNLGPGGAPVRRAAQRRRKQV